MQARDIREVLTGLAYSDNTLKTHTQQIQQYLRFCSRLGLPRVSDTSAAAWVLHASEVLHLRKATVKAKLAAYKWAHATLWDRGEAKTTTGSVLYLTQRAIARRAEDREPKLAVGRQGLGRMLENRDIGMQPDKWAELSAWWLLSYKGFLRCSEAASLMWENISFQRGPREEKSMEFTLAVAGRQIFKNHAEAITFRVNAAVSDVCAVKAMLRWCRLCNRPRSGRVFVVSTDDARRLFQDRAASVLGGQPSQYGLHSLRAGAATDAEWDGRPISEIKFMGRWQSASVLQYMRAGERLAAEFGLPRAGGRAIRVV